MATANDPTAPVLRAVERYQARLFELWKSVFKRIASKFSAARGFFDNVVNRGQEIAERVGQAVVSRIAGLVDTVFDALEAVPQMVKSALRLGNRIVALIRRAADPSAILGTLKRLFMRYVKALKDIQARVAGFLQALDPLGTALAIVNTFRNVLRLVVSWVGQVTSASSAVRKAKSLLKRVVKEMRREVKEAVQLRREVLRLRPG